MGSKSWVSTPEGSDFSLQNLPFGIITHNNGPTPRPAVAIGSFALDLAIFSRGQGFADLASLAPSLHVFEEQTLKGFAELGRPAHQAVREFLHQVFEEKTPYGSSLRDNAELRVSSLIPLEEIQMQLPFHIGDYTDFYVGKHHAYNVGCLFRGPENALQPNYTHMPIGYHGRASSIVVSGTPIRRPWGQILDESKKPVFHPSRKLDIELELGAFITKSNDHGDPVPLREAESHIFGYVLLNDWSARDIQAWEYVPLGPFNGKNFATTISPWVVLADALETFRTQGIENQTPLQPYLQTDVTKGVWNMNLEVSIKSKSRGECQTPAPQHCVS